MVRETKNRRCGHCLASTLLMMAGLAGGMPSAAQADVIYRETFEQNTSIGRLEVAGWTFRNQSTLQNRLGWDTYYSGGPVGPHSLEGSTWAGDGEISTWAIMPEIAGLRSGLPMTFHARGAYGNPPRYDWLELRYSPSGGTSTGMDHDDVGDFTEVVWSATPQELGLWFVGPIEVEVPGDGRFAWRYARTGPDESGVMAIDGIEVITPNEIPIPGPGQMVHWTLDMSPISIDSDLTIPATGTVIIDAGVSVQFQAGRRLRVEGTLEAAGTSPQTVTIAGNGGLTVADGGVADLTFARVGCQVDRQGNSLFLLRDGTLTAGTVFSGSSRFATSIFERSTIQVPTFEPWGHVAFIDSSFTGSTMTLYHYALLDGLTSQGQVRLYRGYQSMLVDDLSITGVNGSALVLHPETWGASDFLIGPNVSLTGNGFPLELSVSGLHPDSVLPQSGNNANAVRFRGSGGGLRYNRATLPNLLPYRVEGSTTIQGETRIEPGARFEFVAPNPDSGITILGTQSDFEFVGTPDAPIEFVPTTPGAHWGGGLAFNGGHVLLRDVLVDSSGVGALQSEILALDSTIQNSPKGVNVSNGFFRAQGSQFLNNTVGVEEDFQAIFVGLDLNSYGRPNIFEGNETAVLGILGANGEFLRIPAENNWWGAADGPSSVAGHLGGSYTGSGDAVTDNVDARPWETERPDLAADRPPQLALITRPYMHAVAGETLILEWEASDDHRIASQEIQVQQDLEWVTIEEIDPADRAVEMVVPETPASVSMGPRFRLLVKDTAGQQMYRGFDLRMPRETPGGNVSFTNDLSRVYMPQEEFEVCYSAFDLPRSPQIYLELSADERWVRGPAGWGGDNCTFSTLRLPNVSTDRARLAIDGSGGNNTEWYFSEYFEIRPDARLGDAPPQVEMTSPADGAQFTGGGVIPIAWTASDDEGLRSFKIQASFNGGHTWHLVREDLPGDSTGFNWKLPASEGIDELRLRVVAVDHRFQNSSAGDDRAFGVLSGNACAADLDGDGDADVNDFFRYLDLFAAGDAGADLDGDGDIDVNDFFTYLDLFATGC